MFGGILGGGCGFWGLGLSVKLVGGWVSMGGRGRGGEGEEEGEYFDCCHFWFFDGWMGLVGGWVGG